MSQSPTTDLAARLIDPAEAGASWPLTLVAAADCAAWRAGLAPTAAAWAAAQGFDAAAGSVVCLPGADDGSVPGAVAIGLGATPDPALIAEAAGRLPPAIYRLTPSLPPPGWTAGAWAHDLALFWALAGYRFDRYRASGAGSAADRDPGSALPMHTPRLVWPDAAARDRVTGLVAAIAFVRDLVNTPACDLGPAELAEGAAGLAARHGARLTVTQGDGLLRAGYPLVHAVGRASPRAPRLIDLAWGDPAHPAVTLVGKGVCFDSGGLDLKTAGAMRLMKKDMGGAAHVLALAQVVMTRRLPVFLRVLCPAVDNAVSGDAFRPGDILTSRRGLTVEVDNTDAEGRLILADALTEASHPADPACPRPALVVDCATLTGAARVALGTEIPALFTPSDVLAGHLLAAAEAEHDPLWRLPLWAPYRRMLDSPVADLVNSASGPHAGAITAALFLERFVMPGPAWAHIDLFAWAPKARPGQTEGGAAQGLRALLALVEGVAAGTTVL